ncbi:hypothetical protein YPPY36_4466, partial [Yersinia pestis PY-36]
MRERRA